MPIEFKHVDYIYTPDSPFEKAALKDINLTIDDGEFVGLIGHTGSGKSTLAQHMNGLIRPTSGQVLVDGVDTADKTADIREVRRRVGLVFQYPEHQLFEETVRKDIAFGPTNLGCNEQEIEQRVITACTQVGLDTALLDKSPFELSGGQKRRAAIAGVLAMKPNVLVLDEPAAGLDPRGRRHMLKLIKELHVAGGVTVVMVSHSMDDIAGLAQRLLVVNEGQLAFDGTPREVFAHIDELKSIHLGVPAAAELARRLRERGWEIPADTYLLSELREIILQKKRGDANAE